MATINGIFSLCLSFFSPALCGGGGWRGKLGRRLRELSTRRRIRLHLPRTEAKNLEQNESDEMTTGGTQEIVPPNNDLRSFTYGGKRILGGRALDSPSKRLVSPKRSLVKTSSFILTSFVHTPRGPGDKLRVFSTTESDNHLTDMGLTEEDGRKGKLSSLPVIKQSE
mgnify:CR=1 FL=1